MSGEKDLKKLLCDMSPHLREGEYIFITLSGEYGDHSHLKPLCSFQEKEGLTLIIPRTLGEEHSHVSDEFYRCISLEVHSSLDAVGLTAAVSGRLASAGISANVVAAYYHDHVFVQSSLADKAMEVLKELSSGNSSGQESL